MGSITSRPKVPSSPQVIFVPAPSAPAPSAPSSGSGSSGAGTPPPAADPQEVAAQVRRENLLRRDRGRLGTILSGFRGFLTSQSDSGRKTLLGE